MLVLWFEPSRVRPKDAFGRLVGDSDLMGTDVRGLLRFCGAQLAGTGEPIAQSLALIIGGVDVLTVVPGRPVTRG